MESLTDDFKADNASLICSNDIPEDNTDTPEKQVNLNETLKASTDMYEVQAHEEASDVREQKVEILEMKVEEYKLKVETLEAENARLRDELSRKVSF